MNAPQNDVRWLQRFQQYQKALRLFEEAVVKNSSDRQMQEGLIQRFEYTFELSWKLLQDLLDDEGYKLEIKGPRSAVETAFSSGFIKNGKDWMLMLKARNETTHLYDEKVFLDIYSFAHTKALQLHLDLEKFCLLKKQNTKT